jgi:transposase
MQVSPLSLHKLNTIHSLSKQQTSNVIARLQAGDSVRKVSKSLGISLGSVSNIRKTQCPNLPPSSIGRPLKLSNRNIQHAVHLITSGEKSTATEVANTLQEITNRDVSAETVRRALKRTGMKSAVKTKRPQLQPRHRKARIEWAEAHKSWTIEDWKRVVWSDETKINRLGSDGRSWVWKKKGERLSDRTVAGTMKFGGGSIMIWGCMFWEGTGLATKIDGRMDTELYCKILREELMESLDYYGKEVGDIEFQQDNDPKHVSRLAKQTFEELALQVMDWPAQSPDMNPIEHLWGHLKKELAKHPNPPSSIHELWKRTSEEWNKIPTSVCQNLIESMPKRVEAVLRAKGGYTKY